MSKIIIANWKMNPGTEDEALSLAKASDSKNLIIAPPAAFVSAVGKVLKKSSLGAQNVSAEPGGAFTGEVSASQLASIGVKYVIVGHSERRRLGETDEEIAKKVLAALQNQIVPILCIGETKAERNTGRQKEVIERQLKISLSLVAGGYSLSPIVAYEPVWAISTEPGAEADSPENAAKIIEFIRETLSAMPHASSSSSSLRLSESNDLKAPQSLNGLNPRILYGGSVNTVNAEGFLKQEEIEGALVGGASLKADEIKKIIEIAEKYAR